MAQHTIKYTTTLTVLGCASCGIDFGIPDDFEERRRNDHKTFWCPSGHENVFRGETDLERERKRATKLERDLANLQEEARIAWADAKAERAKAAEERKAHGTTKAQLTKTRKRIGGGVCPHCNRSFTALRRHMETRHPQEAAAHEHA